MCFVFCRTAKNEGHPRQGVDNNLAGRTRPASPPDHPSRAYGALPPASAALRDGRLLLPPADNTSHVKTGKLLYNHTLIPHSNKALIMQTSGREFAIIQRYFREYAGTDASITTGIGDDCAVITPTPGMQQAITVDTSIADRHFPADAPAFLVGRRALNVSLSDLAAMGAGAHWFTLAISLPQLDEAWLAEFSRGLFAAAADADVKLIGGDTTRGPLAITVQCQGELPAGSALLRSGAKAGDTVYITGTPGMAAAGLALYQQKRDTPQALLHAYLDPVPQLALGQKLRGFASSCVDISDGLLADLGHILAASGLGAEIDAAAIPLCEEAVTLFGHQQALEWALGGGDDYLLCFTSPLDSATLQHNGIEPLHAIGVITEQSQCALANLPSGLTINHTGFDHFHEPSI